MHKRRCTRESVAKTMRSSVPISGSCEGSKVDVVKISRGVDILASPQATILCELAKKAGVAG